VAPPGTDPAAAPLVCVQLNATWLPYVVGALMQLVQPAAWATSDPAVLQQTLEDATALISTFGVAEDCSMLTFRFTDTCVLQFSLDGGATWEDVSGWPTYAPACYVGPEGPAGPTGPAGGYTPGTPGNPQDVSLAQQACNIAAYIAAEVLQVSMAQMVSNYNAARDMVDSVVALFELIPGVDAVYGLFVGAAAILYNAYTALTISDFTDASTDATLLADMKCAIYEAILADGMVDSSNFAAIVTAVGAISYAHSDVIDALVAYLNALGATGLEQLQLLGSTYVGDCSTCSSPPDWCFRWDLTASQGPWSLPADLGPSGVWTSGQGLVATSDGSKWEIDTVLNIGSTPITAIEVEYAQAQPNSTTDSFIALRDGPGELGTGNVQLVLAWNTQDAALHSYDFGFGPSVGTRVWIRATSALAGTPNRIAAITLRGTGANPFGASNCT
jgi:hypothetical protein